MENDGPENNRPPSFLNKFSQLLSWFGMAYSADPPNQNNPNPEPYPNYQMGILPMDDDGVQDDADFAIAVANMENQPLAEDLHVEGGGLVPVIKAANHSILPAIDHSEVANLGVQDPVTPNNDFKPVSPGDNHVVQLIETDAAHVILNDQLPLPVDDPVLLEDQMHLEATDILMHINLEENFAESGANPVQHNEQPLLLAEDNPTEQNDRIQLDTVQHNEQIPIFPSDMDLPLPAEGRDIPIVNHRTSVRRPHASSEDAPSSGSESNEPAVKKRKVVISGKISKTSHPPSLKSRMKKSRNPIAPTRRSLRILATAAARRLSTTPTVHNRPKKRAKRSLVGPNAGDFRRYTYEVFKNDPKPDVRSISVQAMNCMNSFMNDIFERVAAESSALVKYNHKATLTEGDIQRAVQLIIPGELGLTANVNGQRALARYKASQDAV